MSSPVSKKSTYLSTAQKMDRAFLELLNKKEFAFITVKDICKKAGVNRSTFYLHYETIDDLLNETAIYVTNTFDDYLKARGAYFSKNEISSTEISTLYLTSPKFLIPYLDFIKENLILFEVALKETNLLMLYDKYEEMYKDIAKPILLRMGYSKENTKEVFNFYVSGLMAIIKDRIKVRCSWPTAKVIEIINECLNKK